MSPSIEKMDKNLKKIVHMFKKICNNVVKFGDIMAEMPGGFWLFLVKRCLKAYGWYRVNTYLLHSP